MNIFRHKKAPLHIIRSGLVLDLGCGKNKTPGAVGLDSRQFPGVDIVADLEGPLPIDDNTYDVVYANQVFEHVTNLVGLMHEIHRVLKPGGKLLAQVPYFRSAWAHCDITHVRCFTTESMDIFIAGSFHQTGYTLSDMTFSAKEVFLDTEYKSTLARRVFSSLALWRSYWFENSALSFLYPFEQLTFLLTK
jgi:SAM-dependent methyltransferase